MGRRSPKKGISNEKVKDMVIGPGKPKRFNKSPWEYKNGMGQGCLKD